MQLISRLVSSEVDVVDVDSCVEECADDLVCPALRLLLPRTSEARRIKIMHWLNRREEGGPIVFPIHLCKFR
jgi:hypothetical protein